jgi:hypothetical protein
MLIVWQGARIYGDIMLQRFHFGLSPMIKNEIENPKTNKSRNHPRGKWNQKRLNIV